MELPNLQELTDQVEMLGNYIQLQGVGLELDANVHISAPWRESTGVKHPVSVRAMFTLRDRGSAKRETFRSYDAARLAISDYIDMLEEIEQRGEMVKESISACCTASTRCYKLRGKMYIVSSVVGHGKSWWREELDAAR